MIYRKLFLTGLTIVMLEMTACGSVNLPETTAIPTQTVWRVSFPSELAWMADDFGSCLDTAWNIGIIAEERQELLLQDNPADVMLVWGDVEPQGLAAWQIGTDDWVMVVNPALSLQEISASELMSIYQGDVREWSQIDVNLTGQIHAWVYPEYLSIFGQFEASLNGIERLSPYLNIAPDVKAMIEAVAEDPLAVGFIPAAWPEHGLKLIGVTGLGERSVPVVALSGIGENEYLSAWLACLSGLMP